MQEMKKKWKCVIFKCYSSEELITLNTLLEVVPTWYSFHSWVDWSNADKVSCSRRKHIDAGVRTVDLLYPKSTNRSMREGRIESRHSIMSLEGMGTSSHDLGAEIRMHSITVDCDTFSNEEKVAAVVQVSSVEVTFSDAMLAPYFCTLLVKCLMKILGRSALG